MVQDNHSIPHKEAEGVVEMHRELLLQEFVRWGLDELYPSCALQVSVSQLVEQII